MEIAKDIAVIREGIPSRLTVDRINVVPYNDSYTSVMLFYKDVLIDIFLCTNEEHTSVLQRLLSLVVIELGVIHLKDNILYNLDIKNKIKVAEKLYYGGK